MSTLKKYRKPGFFIKVTNPEDVVTSQYENWRVRGVTGRRTDTGRQDDVAEVLEIKILEDGTSVYNVKNLFDEIYIIKEAGVDFFAKDYTWACERIKSEFDINRSK